MTDGKFYSEEDIDSTAPEKLKERINRDENVFVLDTRSEDDFEEWHISGESTEIVNYPYFTLLDGIPEDLLVELPEE